MKQVDSVVQKDPLKLRDFDKGDSSVTSKTMYYFLAGIPLFLVMSLLFYVISSATDSSPSSVQPATPVVDASKSGDEDENQGATTSN